MHTLALFTLLATAAAAATTKTLYATHYNGTVYTLSLNLEDKNPDNALSVSSGKDTCGDMPSWLSLDRSAGVLYCSDEGGNATVPGSLTVLSTASQGTVEEIVKVEDVGAGVNSAFYGGESGAEYLAVAHYGASALTTFPLPLTPATTPLQTLSYNLTDRPAPKPQQDASHPHQVLLDPSGEFLISPDLGMDLIHVYTVNASNGRLDEGRGVEFPAGSGPRHGFFTSEGGETRLYTVSELSGELTVFDVSYSTYWCPTFHKIQSIIPYPNGTLPSDATPAGIQIREGNIYISLRSDQSYPGIESDSIATLFINSDGTATFHSLTPSYGKVPRTLVVNDTGDLVAIGNQASASVVVVRRLESGELGEVVGRVLVGETGAVGEEEGLSSVVWG